MLREEAQSWADRHGMQTLTTAMGSLMNLEVTVRAKSKKSSEAWSKYVRGASAVFAWHISQGERVTMLTPPPPQRFHPSKPSTSAPPSPAIPTPNPPKTDPKVSKPEVNGIIATRVVQHSGGTEAPGQKSKAEKVSSPGR